MNEVNSAIPRLTENAVLTFCIFALFALNLSIVISPFTSSVFRADRSGSTSFAGAELPDFDVEPERGWLAWPARNQNVKVHYPFLIC